MILSFSQKWPASMGEWAGQPNYFVKKIWSGLTLPEKANVYYDYADKYLSKFGNLWDISEAFARPKLHTMRHDPNNRWKPGMKIHPVINNRSKNQFQFAPVMECVAIQHIEIQWDVDCPSVYISSKPDFSDKGCFYFSDPEGTSGRAQMEVLAQNDGFESLDQFFAWFNADFKGKIIHWTNLKY